MFLHSKNYDRFQFLYSGTSSKSSENYAKFPWSESSLWLLMQVTRGTNMSPGNPTTVNATINQDNSFANKYKFLIVGF